MPQIDQLMIATRNPGKVREIAVMLSRNGITATTLADFPSLPDVEETGQTFLENAIIKAAAYSSAAGCYALADDSGLEVAALDGRPGVLSARYAGESASYETKIQTLLREVEDAAAPDRSARFVCAMAFADPSGNIIWSAEGVCDGKLTRSPRGANGFGYDPIFMPFGFGQTFGELEDEIKSAISHRAKATEAFMRFFPDFIGV